MTSVRPVPWGQPTYTWKRFGTAEVEAVVDELLGVVRQRLRLVHDVARLYRTWSSVG